MAGKANNTERLAAIESAIERLVAHLGTPGGAAGATPVQDEPVLYDYRGAPLGALPPAAAPITVVMPKSPAPAPMDWTPIITALIGMAATALPALLSRPDPMEQLAGLMGLMSELRESERGGLGDAAEAAAAFAPLLAMLKSNAPPPTPASANGASLHGQLAQLGIDPALLGTLLARQTSADGAASPT